MVVPLSEVGHQRVTHPSATLTPRRIQELPFDLHALGTPLAFILSQDQTLRREFYAPYTRNYFFWINCFAQSSCLLFLSLFNCQCSRSPRLFYRQKNSQFCTLIWEFLFLYFSMFRAYFWATTLLLNKITIIASLFFLSRLKSNPFQTRFVSFLTFSMFRACFCGDIVCSTGWGF